MGLMWRKIPAFNFNLCAVGPEIETVDSTLLTLWGIPFGFQMLFLRVKVVVSGLCFMKRGRIVNWNLLHASCKRNRFSVEWTFFSTHSVRGALPLKLIPLPRFPIMSVFFCLLQFLLLFTINATFLIL